MVAVEPQISTVNERNGTTLILLGTQAGPPVEKSRAGISSALVVDGATYIVDCGRSALTQFVNADMRLDSVRGLFITHLHHDHVADYYNFFLLGGIGPNSRGDILSGPIPVYGPGSAGALPPTLGAVEAPTVAPESPTPGLVELTDACHSAYAYSSNLFLRDSQIADVRALMEVLEIRIPDIGAHPIDATAPTMAPFKIMEDDRVRVTATLVPHGRCFPSFAYRFDTDYGAITFSGDTTASDNLVVLSRKSEILVHEAINVHGAPLSPERRDQMLRLHTPVQQVGLVASRAEVGHLVLSHLIDFAKSPIDDNEWLEWVQAVYNGKVTVGADLQRIALSSGGR